MLHQVRSLAAVLMLGLPVAAHAQQTKAPPPKAPLPPPPTASASPMGTYTYCDAKMLSVLWKGSISASKATIRTKVSAKNTTYLNAELLKARANAKKDATARCNFDEAGLSYNDVQTLAKMWATTPGKAKAMIEDKIIAGNEKVLRDMLATAPGKPGVTEDPTATFLKQEKYTYCDVKLLSAYWKSSAKDAKARIGVKIQAGADDYLRKEIHASVNATKLKCTYTEGGFTLKDAQTLAKLWSLTLAESKATIERKLLSGSSIYLKEEIRGSAESPDDAYTAFHAQTKYTYCDAKMIGALWGKSMSDGKVAIGTKLKSKNTRALVKLVADARKNAKKNEAAQCSYDEAGFSYSDVVILGKLWKKTEADVKTLIPQKIAAGQEATIRLQLKKASAKKPPPNPPMMKAPAPMPPTTKAPAPPTAAKPPMTKPAIKAE